MAMRLKIIQTGSAGNNYLLNFSDNKSLIVEVGKGTFKRFLKEVQKSDIENCLGYIYTHEHNDHAGDKSVFEKHGFKQYENDTIDRDVKIYPFAVRHNVENKGFFIVNHATKEALIFITDFTEIVDFQKFISTYKVLLNLRYSVNFAVECSYCEFLEKKLSDTEKIGLQNHFSDEKLIGFIKTINQYSRNYQLVTIHASGRNFDGNLSKRYSSVCPPDYLLGYIKMRTDAANVHFGINGCDYYF